MGGLRRVFGGGALAVFLLGALVVSPAGSASAQSFTTSFTGTCQFQAETTVSVTTTYGGGGTCTGSLQGVIAPGADIGTTSGTFPSTFEANDEQGVWLPPSGVGLGATPEEPILVTGQGQLLIGAPCGGGGYCLNEINFAFTQATPLAFTALGSTGGLGLGLVIPGYQRPDSVTLVAVALSS
jgi:hypothetical protein